MTGSGFFYGYTCGGENLVSSLACPPNGADGLEAYYAILMPAGSSITADGVLWLLGGCTEPFTCLALADAGLGGDPEVITYTNTNAEDLQVYLVVDSLHPNNGSSHGRAQRRKARGGAPRPE